VKKALSEVFPRNMVVRNCVFSRFGSVNSLKKGTLSFAIDRIYFTRALSNPNVSGIVTLPNFVDDVNRKYIGIVKSSNPLRTFYEAYNKLVEEGALHPEVTHYIDNSARIHPTAIVKEPVHIGAHVKIGAFTLVNAYSVIESGVELHEGVIIGATGLEAKRIENEILHVKHGGGVFLHKNVQVLATAVISRGIFNDFTHIGENSIVSIRVNIGHDSVIGQNCFIAGHSQVSGSCTIGNNVWIGPSSCISNGVCIEDNAIIRLGSIVIRDVSKRGDVSGNFAVDHMLHLRQSLKS